MIYRILGFILLVLSAVFFAFVMSNNEKKRILQLSVFCDTIKEITRKIESFNMPIEEIMLELDPRSFLALGYKKSDTPRSFEALIDNSSLLLGRREKELLFAFSGGLGKKYREEQISFCNYYYKELSDIHLSSVEDFPKKRKLYYTLFICGALALVILMI